MFQYLRTFPDGRSIFIWEDGLSKDIHQQVGRYKPTIEQPAEWYKHDPDIATPLGQIFFGKKSGCGIEEPGKAGSHAGPDEYTERGRIL